MEVEVYYLSVKGEHTESSSQHTTNMSGCSPRRSYNNPQLIWVSLSLSGLIPHKSIPQLYSAQHWPQSWAAALAVSITTKHLHKHYWDFLLLPKLLNLPQWKLETMISGPLTAAFITSTYLSSCDERRCCEWYLKQPRMWLPASARASVLLI